MSLVIRASGMVTAAGFNARATCAAIRAGVSGIRAGMLTDWSSGEPLLSGRPATPHWWEGNDMLAELAAPAILECLADLSSDVDRREVPILVLLSPPGRPHRPANLDADVREGLRARLPFDAAIETFQGRTALYEALARANAAFASRGAPHAVIVGVDSFLRPDVANAYMDQFRILMGDNSNGFIPGEAACAVLVGPGRGEAEELQLTGWGVGEERSTIGGDRPLTGDGLTDAVRTALDRAGLRMAEANYWLTDQNAEHYKAKECTIVQVRLERRDRPADPPFRLWNPIEFLGDIGSAIGPCLMGIALAAARGGYAPGPVALVSLGEDDGRRAAFVLQRQGAA